ncbi:nephrin-like [Eriocheir sinensis]|uniref:nephrin-like n=1 Tax=Eriocheir sinensis TaxID=95602 RepID=UPI0021C90282|nr:nephrin-like [Eriocheir sinensis]
MCVMKFLLAGLLCILTHGPGAPRLVWGQQKQHFRNQPEDQHVIEGNVAIIKCEVGNQAGRVQWAKDGFVLGFNRSIPGYPRYEMIGDGVDGEHHLRIHNTTLNDDADYQCQVGPADGHPPIRGTGHLTVLMAPSAVELLGRGREGLLEVSEGEEVTLECRVEDAKPVAEVMWFKNDQEIHLDSRVDIAEESSKHRRHNLISKISLRLTPADDGSHYSCRAQHPALNTPIRASVKISVQYPPGPPVITGYTTGEAIKAGKERTLTCRSRGGNPLGRVVWYRNNENIDSTDRAEGGESVNEYKFIVDSADNGAVFTCEVRNKLTDKPLLASVKLNVQFPPQNVRVTGPKQARVGDNVTLHCFAENSNPPAKVSWVMDGQPRPETSTRNETTRSGGWHTDSELTLAVPHLNRDITFTCHATNQALGETKVDTFKLPILRPPQPPYLRGYSEGTGISVGSQQVITCVSIGGNPVAHLQWYRNGQKIASHVQNVDGVSSAEIQILAEPEDNGAQYRCEAHNAAAASPVSVSTTLVVFFPPETVKITQSPPNLRAGEKATLTCEAGPSNPAATITWLREGYEMTGSPQTPQHTRNGGTKVVNKLTLSLTAADDGLTYTCKAFNTKLQKDVRQSVTLRVNYKPTFLTDPPPVVDVVIGESEVLNLTARANPGPVRYSWTRHGLPLPHQVNEDSWRNAYSIDMEEMAAAPPSESSYVAADGPLLYLKGVTVDDAGDYELKATNSEGTTDAKIYLNVQYPPSIKYTSRLVTVSEGQDAHLECAADGNPLTEDMMRWSRENYDFTRTEQSFGGKKASLMVLRANRNDTGVFSCVVNNGIGKEAMSNATLVVKTKPQVERSQLLNRAAVELGGTGRLRCLAEGAPDISFSWKRDGHLLSNGARPDKYENETIKTGLVTWASTFIIKSVREQDYGDYVCVAENELGASTTRVRFTRPTQPDPPLALKILNTTHDSVTLAWIPGFDGGQPQYFRIRYRSKSSSSYQYVDVLEFGVYTYTVPGLNLNTEYYFSIQSRNDVGTSDFRGEFVRAITRSEAPPTPVPSSNVGKEASKLPGLWVVIIVLVATALLALNVSAIVCIVRRRRNKRASPPTKKTPPPSISASTMPKALPISSTQEGSDQASSKSTTNTMYAPSSYNDTVVGETLSSISEKSRESYTQEDSVVDYEEQTHKHAASTYLIDQIEPPPEYASQTPSQPSSAAYDPQEDDYAEVLRRNAYNHQLGKVTPRPPSRATHYSTSPETRGYLSFSYTPSPTGVPNGAAQYHAGGPSVTLGLHDHGHGYPADMGSISVEGIEHSHALQSLGLDSDPPPSLGLEQHSIPSEHPSLTLDPHSITIDHPVIAVTDFSNRNGDLRVQPTSLSTFNPNPSPSTYSESDLEGHLV